MILNLLDIQHILNMHKIIITIQSGNRNEMFSVDVSINLLKTAKNIACWYAPLLENSFKVTAAGY